MKKMKSYKNNCIKFIFKHSKMLFFCNFLSILLVSLHVNAAEIFRQEEDFFEKKIIASTRNTNSKIVIDELSDIKTKNNTKLLIPIGSFLLGGLTAIPTFDWGYATARGNTYLGYVLGTFFYTNILLSSAWGYNFILKDFEPFFYEKKIGMSDANISIGGHIISHILGLITAIPAAYISYEYNTIKWLACVSFFAEYISATLGFLEMAGLDFTNFFNDETLVDGLDQKRDIILNYISNDMILNLLNLPENIKNKKIEQLNDNNLTVNNFLDITIDILQLNQNNIQFSKENNIKNCFSYVFSLLILTNSLNIFYFSYSACTIFIDVTVLDYALSILSALAATSLYYPIIRTVSNNTYDYIFSLNDSPQKFSSISSYFYPITSKFIGYSGIFLAITGGIVSQFIVQEELKSFMPYGYAISFSIVAFLCTLFVDSNMNAAFLNDFILSYSDFCEEQNYKKFLNATDKMESFIGLIKSLNFMHLKNLVESPKVNHILKIINEKNNELNEDTGESTPLLE